MKRFLTVIGIAGILILVVGATAFAARAPQAVTPQATPQASATPVPATPTSAPGSAGQSSVQQQGNAGCCVMPFGQAMRGMGRMGGMTFAPALRSGASAGVGAWQRSVPSTSITNTQMSGSYGPGTMGGASGTMPGQLGMAVDDMISMMAGVTPMQDDVEKLLGMNHQDLYNQMAAGKSLVQIGADKGVTEGQLIDGIMAGRKTAFDQAVAAGRMTRVQADAMLGYMQNNIKTMVDTPGMGLGTGGWGMMWNTQPSQPGQSGQPNQSGQQNQSGQPGSTSGFLGLRFGPGRMHR